MGKLSKKAKAKMLKGMCLHCAFLKIHQDKWPNWRPDKDNQSQDAFNDLVRSTVKITAHVFSMLDEADQMIFMRQVSLIQATQDIDAKPIKEILEAVKQAVQRTTKH